MKKTVLISLLSIALICVSCGWTSARGITYTGETVTAQYCAGQTITALKASSMFKIDLSYGAESSVEVTINKEFVEYLEVDVANGELTLRLNDDWHDKSKNNSDNKMVIRARVVCKSLNSLRLNGMAKCNISGEIPSTGLTAILNGMSDCSGGTINSSSDCKISLNGMSNFNSALKINGNCDVTANGMSNFLPKMTASGVASFDLNGMSKINISGSAATTNIKSGGMSKINLNDFDTQISKLSSSGMSTINSK